ncbi:MAG: hypothetical protein QXJ27_08070, partial [Thermoplasmata archaeon]
MKVIPQENPAQQFDVLIASLFSNFPRRHLVSKASIICGQHSMAPINYKYRFSISLPWFQRKES